MASFHDNTLSELALQRELLSDLGKPSIGKTAAILRRCTRLIFESPLCITALEDEATRWSHSLPEKTARTFDSAVKHDLYLLALSMQDKDEWDSGVHRWLLSPVAENARQWGNNLMLIANRWHRDLAGTLPQPYFSIQDREAVALILDQLKTHLVSLPADDAHSELRNNIGNIDTVLRRLADFRRNLELASSLADALGTLSKQALLREFHAETTAMLAPTDLDVIWGSESLLYRFATDPKLRDDLVGGAIHLIDLISFRIRRQAVPAHVLARLVMYLERFAKEDIKAKLATSQRAAESIIQFHVDSFIFGEGLYPITHAEAANGKIDTFFETTSPLLEEAEKPGNTAVLIELKQSMEVSSKEALEKVVNAALQQAAQYQSHLKAHRKWEGHKVVVFVAYGGNIRYVAARADVYMVYLGDKTPSQAKAVMLSLPAQSEEVAS